MLNYCVSVSHKNPIKHNFVLYLPLFPVLQVERSPEHIPPEVAVSVFCVVLVEIEFKIFFCHMRPLQPRFWHLITL